MILRLSAPKEFSMTKLFNYPAHLIRRLHQISVAIFAAEARATGCDLTPVQYGVLVTLREHPGVDQATLAGLISHDRVTIGGVVARLEARGYVRRKVRADDRRARSLTLTKAGEALLQNVEPVVISAQDRLMSPLDDADQQEFLRMIRIMTETSDKFGRGALHQQMLRAED